MCYLKNYFLSFSFKIGSITLNPDLDPDPIRAKILDPPHILTVILCGSRFLFEKIWIRNPFSTRVLTLKSCKKFYWNFQNGPLFISDESLFFPKLVPNQMATVIFYYSHCLSIRAHHVYMCMFEDFSNLQLLAIVDSRFAKFWRLRL